MQGSQEDPAGCTLIQLSVPHSPFPLAPARGALEGVGRTTGAAVMAGRAGRWAPSGTQKVLLQRQLFRETVCLQGRLRKPCPRRAEAPILGPQSAGNKTRGTARGGQLHSKLHFPFSSFPFSPVSVWILQKTQVEHLSFPLSAHLPQQTPTHGRFLPRPTLTTALILSSRCGHWCP